MLYSITALSKEPKEFEITVPEHARVGIMFSGGIDSTALLYLLNEQRKQGLFAKLTAFTVDCAPYIKAARLLLNQKEFEGVEWVATVDNLGRTDGVIKASIASVYRRDDIDLLFTGVTVVPSDEIEGMPPVRVTREQVNLTPKLRCPILELTKDYVIQLYEDGLVPKHLLRFTRSCSTDQDTHCGKCFPCNERRWALEKFGIDLDAKNV